MRRFATYVITERRYSSNKTVEYEGTFEQLVNEFAPMIEKAHYLNGGYFYANHPDKRRLKHADKLMKIKRLGSLCSVLDAASNIIADEYKLSHKYYTIKRK